MNKSLLRPVRGPMFAKCMGDVKHVIPGDMLCPDCEIITEAEYSEAVMRRFTDATSEAHARLMSDLEPLVLAAEARRAPEFDVVEEET